MHYFNNLITFYEKEAIDDNTAKSIDEINATLQIIESDIAVESVNLKTVGKLIRLINTHNSLKYEFKVMLHYNLF